MPTIALVNSNTIAPPIAPLGLEYIAEACRERGMNVQFVDLCFKQDPRAALKSHLSPEIDLVGITLRNTDTCLMLNHRSFIEPLREMIQTVRTVTDTPIVVGGAGFSVAPEAVLKNTGGDYGIIGDGEVAFAQLAESVSQGRQPVDVAGCVWREGDTFRRNEPHWPDLSDRPGLC
ncbi:MAG: cobalamin-dependent protein, partial [Armatimonadota bacterium]